MFFGDSQGVDKKRIVLIGAWAFLYVAFVTVALLVRNHVYTNNIAEIWGWDYRTFVDQIQCWDYISYFGFRHPGLGIVLSPLVAIEHLRSGAYLLVMPGVALLTAYLIYRMAGLIGLIVWLCFPTTWLMAAIPESFPIAQLALVGSLFLIDKRLLPQTGDGTVGMKMVLFLAALNGMITLTNGLKPILAYAFNYRDRLKLLLLVGVMVLVALGGVGFFFIRSVVCGRSCFAGIAMTLSWIPETRNLFQELYGFFIRPVGLIQGVVIYPLLTYSLWSLREHFADVLFLSIFAFLSVDFLLHLVVGWGMSEPWVFAPHWIFAIPIIIGRGCSFNWKVGA